MTLKICAQTTEIFFSYKIFFSYNCRRAAAGGVPQRLPASNACRHPGDDHWGLSLSAWDEQVGLGINHGRWPFILLTVNSKSMQISGHVWAGDREVKAMHVSIDFGATWLEASLDAAPNKYSWERWRAGLSFPQAGYYEIWAKATDDQGVSQPFAINWNPKGYLNNSMHRIAVNVA